MTKEQYEKQQSILRRVIDPVTGRKRLLMNFKFLKRHINLMSKQIVLSNVINNYNNDYNYKLQCDAYIWKLY